jgi:tyrosine-protein kinase Etk/Wzc
MQHTENKDPAPHTSHPAPAPVSLSYYLLVVAKRSRMIITITLAMAVISIIYSLSLPNIYTAKTLILSSQEDKGMMSAMMAQLGGLATLAGQPGVTIGAPTTTDLYESMLKSEAVKDPIIDRFKLMEVLKDKYRTDAYNDLDKKIAISAGKKDGIITITVDDQDPKRAAEIANAYVDELGKLAIRLNVTGAGQNSNFLEERLASAKADLAKAEENLKAFQSKNKAVQVPAQAEASIKGVAELRAQLAVQEVQLATYRRQFTESSQEVKNLATSVENLRVQIARLEGGGGNSAIPSVGALPSLEQAYVRLKREFNIQESLVELLTKQYEMAMLSEAKDISPFQVIQKARIPEKKSKPSRSKIVLFTTFVTFYMSVMIAFALEKFTQMADKDRARWRELLTWLPFYRRGKVL